MLTPRLTNCPECAHIPALLQAIDCKIASIAHCAYNKIIFGFQTNCDCGTMADLLNYKRILTNRYFNPTYASNYSLEAIMSRITILTNK